MSEEELDLALAAELQAALLGPRCPLEGGPHRAAALNRMCGSVGGDFYDFIAIHEDQTAMVLGDVVGHGVRASLLMAQIMGFLRSKPPSISRPSELMIDLNRWLITLGDRTGCVMPCSMFFGVLDIPSGTCFYVNAGHPRPLLLEGDGRIEPLSCSNLLLGVEDFEPTEGCLTFEPGQRMICYTDGLIDAAGPGGEHFGEDRLREQIVLTGSLEPHAMAQGIFDAVAKWRASADQQDDETLLVIERI